MASGRWPASGRWNCATRLAPFLVLDDLGTEKLSDWVQEKLYAILDWRYGQELPTLVTSNLTLAELASHYRAHGPRLASRIAGMGEEVELRGRDRRVSGQ